MRKAKFVRAVWSLVAISSISFLTLLGFCRAATAAIWAKDAVALDVPCPDRLAKWVPRSASPDGSVAIEEFCEPSPEDVDVTRLRVIFADGVTLEVIPEIPGTIWRPEELLWSPDSKAFIVNGSENAYAGDSFIVYQISGDHVTPSRPIQNAQRDMVRLFPPCRALNREADTCKRIEESPEFNMSVIAWTPDSASVIVFSEVPCSSGYGGIMCQVIGYQLEVRTGRIERRISVRELKRRYQSSMAWKMHDPGPAEYQ